MLKILEKPIRATLAMLTIAVLSAAPALAQDQGQSDPQWSPLLSPEDLNQIAAITDVQVIDIRQEKRLSNGTIPGATWIKYSDWRGPADRPGMPPSEAALEEFLGQAGLRIDRPTVIYNHTGKTMQAGRAAFVYWLLKTAGFEEVAILNGGFKAWDGMDYQVAEAPVTLPPRTIDLDYRFDWWADPVDIFGVASGQLEGSILDARFESQVKKSRETGEPMMSIPFARYIPVGLVTQGLSPERLTSSGLQDFRSGLEGRDITLDSDLLIAICQNGELSALSWFYASEIVKIENVRYYPDALMGWRADGGLLFGLSNDL